MGAKETVDAAISSKKVVVFSKTTCPFCRAAKQGIKELGVKDEDLVVFELNERDDGAAIQAYLATPEVTGQSTVPNIFISGTHVGGNDDFQRKRREGKLPKLNAQ